jgi:EAL domain-containing protein (putative c-di-GMP-specific phosphodiesterase class I)
MACQHVLFGTRDNRVPIPQELRQEDQPEIQEAQPEIRFQPIVDTFDHKVMGHQCLVNPRSVIAGFAGGLARCDAVDSIEAARLRASAIRSASMQPRRGLYFFNLIPASIDDPETDMHSTIQALFNSPMHPGNVVFEVAESDLARESGHSHRIREYLGKSGFGFALSSAGLGAGAYSFHAVSEFAPDYINLDNRLVQNADRPACAPIISRLVQMAEHSGARVVAEGVDHVRTVENLWLPGVRFMQGPLFGDPSISIV